MLTAERNNRMKKEAFRTGLIRSRYSRLPKIMIIKLAEMSADRLNWFPANNGVSKYSSPRTIIEDRLLDYKKDCAHEFGTYVQAHTQNTPVNSMNERTLDCIYLRSNNNNQGGHVVINLHTGKRITRA